ncbi:unnamed protein product, partial [Discosporangium mesarthrocarpum]
MVLENQPLQIVEKVSFRRMIAATNPTLSVTKSREAVMDQLVLKKAGECQKVKEELKGQVVAVTTDGSTGKDIRSFISLTLHYIDKKWTTRRMNLRKEDLGF